MCSHDLVLIGHNGAFITSGKGQENVRGGGRNPEPYEGSWWKKSGNLSGDKDQRVNLRRNVHRAKMFRKITFMVIYQCWYTKFEANIFKTNVKIEGWTSMMGGGERIHRGGV